MKSPKPKFLRIKSSRIFHLRIQNIIVEWNVSRTVNGLNKRGICTLFYTLSLPAENVYCRRALLVLRNPARRDVRGYGLLFKMMILLIHDFLPPYLPMFILMEITCFTMSKSKMMTLLGFLEPMSLLFQ